ncbi:MAG: hypothetical protein ABSF69_11210 [Polyangiaceae bacterium]|jgi:hypothetical protein
MTRLVVSLFGVALAVGGSCSKNDRSSPPTGIAATTETAAATPTPAAPATAPTTETAAATPTDAEAEPEPDTPPEPPCGDKPLPRCTLRTWMKAHSTPAMNDHDFDALATVLDKIATLAPPGYPNWASISRDGASAARALDLEAVRASCRSCHRQYKDRYKKELHDRPI